MEFKAFWHKNINILKSIGTRPEYSDIDNITISWVNVMSVLFVIMAIPYFFDAGFIFIIVNIIALIFNILPLFLNYIQKTLLAKVILIFPPIIITIISVLLFYPYSWMTFYMVVMQIAIFVFLPFLVFSPKEEKYIYITLFFVGISIFIYWELARHYPPLFPDNNVKIQNVFWAIFFSFIVTVLLGIAYYRRLVNQYTSQLILSNQEIQNQKQIVDNQYNILVRLNEELSDSLAQNQDFLQMTSHDLKSPINAILGLTDIIQHETDLIKVRQYMEYVSYSAQKSLNLIENLREITMLESGTFAINLSYIPLAKLIEEVVAQNIISAEKKGQKILSHIEVEALAYVDALKAYQVVDNVLNNAIKYSDKNANIYIRLGIENGFALIQIKDEGQGFSENEKDKMFQKFSRLSARPTGNEISTGLGLYICKRLVELQNGRITAKSEGKNKGSIFSIYFPLTA